MKTRMCCVLLVTGMLAGLAAGGDAPATTGAAPRGVIDQFLKDILAILRDPGTSREQKSQKVRALADQIMDIDTFARLTMGRFWRDLNDTQRAQFTAALKQHLTNTYGHTSDEYTNEDLNIVSDQQEPNGDWTVISRVIGDKNGTRQEIAKVNYRLRQTGGQWKVMDVTIDGVSLMSNFRSQFQDVMTNGGFDKLLRLLRDKNAAAK